MFIGDPGEGVPEERLSEIKEKIEADCQKDGVYLDQFVYGVDPTGMSDPQLLLTFRLGTVAFSDRVIVPEEDQVGDQVRVMEVDLQRQAWEEARKDFTDNDENPFEGLR